MRSIATNPRDSHLITIFTTPKNQTAGKTFTRLPNGTVGKNSCGISAAMGVVHYVPGVDQMVSLLRSVSNNPHCAIMLGCISGTDDGKPFTLLPETKYRVLLRLDENAELPPTCLDNDGNRYAARLKRNIIGSHWMLLDRDNPPGMPPELASLSQAEWFGRMEQLVPGLSSAAKVVVPSSSGRVLVDGIPQESNSIHVYVQISEPSDLERIGSAMLMNSFSVGLGFKKPHHSRETGLITGFSNWSIFDPTTFSRERLCYEGAPTVVGAGLTLTDAPIEVYQGDCVDTSLISSPDGPVDGMELVSTGSGGYQIQDRDTLTLDTIIETKKHGTMTVRQYRDGGYGKLRCQCFNRDSGSWNGFLNRHKDGTIFFFDNGTRMKFTFVDVGQLLQGVQIPTVSTLPNSPIPMQTNSQFDPVNWMEDYVVDDDTIESFDEPDFIYPNLVIKGHMSVFPAEPNGGKTTLFTYIAGEIAKRGYNVSYVNADIGQSDSKRLHRIAKEKGFKLLLPDLVQGGSMMQVVENLKMMNQMGGDFRHLVFIFDTLKKMANVISKDGSKALYATLRGLTAKGATIILLAHTNKYKGEDGKPVYEGTGDLRADVDNLIYLLPEKRQDGSMVISTFPDKVRGKFQPITFEVDAEREVSPMQSYVDVAQQKQLEATRARDQEPIELITAAIKSGNQNQSQIVDYIKTKSSVGRPTIRRVLDAYARGPDALWRVTREPKDNAMIYELTEPMEQLLSDVAVLPKGEISFL